MSAPQPPSELELLHQRIDLLARINGQLLARISSLEDRLARLDGGVPTMPDSHPSRFEPAPEPPPPLPDEPSYSPVPESAGPEQFHPQQEPLAPFAEAAPGTSHPSAETAFGLNWLNRIGAFTLILGAAFFFKYAVDNGWIGPTGRILLGLLAGAILLAGAHLLNARRHAVYAQGVAAAGISILYLSFWAAGSLYKLIPLPAAFAALVAVTALAGALAWRSRGIALAALGLIGAYLAPPALSTGEYHPWILFTYLLLINGVWLSFARNMGWRILEFIALPLTVLLAGPVFADLTKDNSGPAGSFLLLGQWIVFILSPIVPFAYVAQALAGIGLGFAWHHTPAVFPVAALALLAAGLAAAHLRRHPSLALTAVASFSLGYAIVRAENSPSAALFLTATAAFALAHAFLPFRLSRSSIGRAELALQPLNAVAYFAAGYNYLYSAHPDFLGIFAVCLGAVYLATGLALRQRLTAQPGATNSVLLLAGAAIALFTAAVPLQFDSFRITILWAFEAAALAWIARRLDSSYTRFAAIAVCALAAFRLLTIDSTILRDPAQYALLANARFATFLLSAAAFALAAWWMRPQPLALAPYFTAHGALLLGLGLEVSSHVRRVTPPGEVFSAELVSLSILLAIYGLAMVAAGVATRTRLNRVVGLVMLGAVILKLYAVDVWSMGRVYRIVAFSALGVLLLSTSFLYSRFRTKIEELLQNEDR
jgi:uncharacterized membrane protein